MLIIWISMNSFKTIVVLSVILLRFDLTVVGKNVTSNKLFFEKCIDMDNEVSLKRMPENPAEYSRALLTGLKRFSIEILRSLHNFESKDSSKGLILSPFSIWSALLVTYMGARGETSKELRSVLGANNMPKHAVGISYQGLRLWYKVKANVSMAKGQSKSQPCSFANKIFINDNLPLTDCMKQYFGEEVQPMGFANDPGKARKKINAWVEGETRNKIKDLIPVGGITQWTTIVIANALYFHSKWQHQFDSSQTEMGSFHVSPTETVQVPYMKMTANLMYGVSETLGATLLELPYANQVTYSLLILLPDASKGIDSLVRKLEPTHLAEVMGNMYDDEISVVIPKFKAEQEFELAGPLYSMGVKKLFDPRFSDLSGFVADPTMSVSKSKDGNTTVNPTITSHGVTVNSVVHKVFISVDEEGTEAAAATAILMARSGRPAFPTRFVVDRPFLFLIRDTATDIILFIGIVRRPNET